MDILSVLNNFIIEGKVVSVVPMGSGHINTTFLVTTNKKKYTLQRINSTVFTNVDALIDNIDKITKFISKKRRSVELIYAKNYSKYFFDGKDYYRLFTFFEGYCIDRVEKEEDMYAAGIAYGQFQADLQDFTQDLYDTIPNFHDTSKRYDNFRKALEVAAPERAVLAKKEIKEYLDRFSYANIVVNKLERGEVPVRVAHNDTKINNVVFDKTTNAPICVIDLDTVMNGCLLYDFGDAIRSGGVDTEEDEKDISKVRLIENYFEAFAKGFLEVTKGFITEEERSLLAFSAILMTYECGMRFLTDYLNGNIYFKTKYEEHNLDRARTQLALVMDMETKLQNMEKILEDIWKKMK